MIWEVKTDDGGLRDKDWKYSWYEPDASKNGGFEGYKNNSFWKDTSICKGSECDTYAFTNAVNAQGLCGANDWRVPSNEELKALVCSDGKYNTLAEGDAGYICTNSNSVTQPTINATYFPNTVSSWFWSSSPYAGNSYYAWGVDFNYGFSNDGSKGSDGSVRLVR